MILEVKQMLILLLMKQKSSLEEDCILYLNCVWSVITCKTISKYVGLFQELVLLSFKNVKNAKTSKAKTCVRMEILQRSHGAPAIRFVTFTEAQSSVQKRTS